MYQTITTIDEMQQVIATDTASLFYISVPECSVCQVLKPKIGETFSENFTEMNRYYIDSSLSPEISAQMSIFAVPTVLIYLNGQEFFRESRNISIPQLVEKVARPYKMLFDE